MSIKTTASTRINPQQNILQKLAENKEKTEPPPTYLTQVDVSPINAKQIQLPQVIQTPTLPEKEDTNMKNEIEQYFQEAAENFKKKSLHHANQIEEATKLVERVQTQVEEGKMPIAEVHYRVQKIQQTQNIEDLIQNSSCGSRKLVDEKIKRDKLREQLQQKSLIEAKLKGIENSIKDYAFEMKQEQKLINQRSKGKLLDDEKHKQFIEKQMKQWHQMQQNREELIRKIEQLPDSKQQAEEEKQQKELQNILDQRREQIKQKLEENKEKALLKQKEDEEINKIYNEIQKRQPLFKQIEKRYVEKVIGQELQTRKKILSEIRDFH